VCCETPNISLCTGASVATAAYEGALIDLCVTNRDDPITELIVKSVVNVTATGVRDPVLIKERAINALGIRKPSAA
jgi:acetyl-CoA carboxylase carboxyltransferase component